MTRQFAALPLALLFSNTLAQSVPAPPIQQVEVTASTALDARRIDTAGKLSVTREDIARYGDINVSTLLKRQPGIAVVNGEVRMRGLGSGYTQILIDGEPAPPGFAVDSLSPSMIERIDVMRNGSAEFGAQAIAGSINIIMRKNHARAQRDLTLAAGSARGYLISPSAALRWADQRGDLAYSLGVELSRPNGHFDERAFESERALDDSIISERVTRTRGGSATRKISLAPRLNWKLAGGDSLAWQAVIDRSRLVNDGCAVETVFAGTGTPFPDSCYRVDLTAHALRSDVAWTHRLGDGKLVAKAAVNRNDRSSDYLFTGSGPSATLARRVLAQAGDHSTTLSGKYLAPLGNAHSLGLGWDGGRTLRTEERMQRDSTFAGAPLYALDEDYKGVIDRMSLFAQDEWTVTPRLQAYLGLRWEGLRTDVSGRTMEQVRHRSSVVSPVAQLLWKPPGTEKDQLRLALSRTYKAPSTRLLVPRRYTVNNGNSPTNPDVRGNPDLRPELAWGLDAGYEHYFGSKGMLSVSAYGRRVEGVTVTEVDPDLRPWIAIPRNNGTARVAGVEADARYAPSPQLDLRANLGLNWSSLDAVRGPDNRLAEQVASTANVGADYRLSPQYTVGASFNVQFGGAVRISQYQSAYTGPARKFDVYALWKMDARSQLRLTVTDLPELDRVSRQAYTSDDGTFRRTLIETNRLWIRLLLETRI
jgi:outer membrane receptor for ferrienterochelin and colicins